MSPPRAINMVTLVSSADRFLAGAQRRRHRGVHVAIAISVGVSAAFATSLIAGASRSSSVVDRVFDAVPKYDMEVFDGSGGLRTEFVRSLPGVSLAVPTNYLAFNLRNAANPITASINSNPTDFALSDPSVRILRGQIPNGIDPFEVVVNQSLADNFSLDVGDTLPVISFAADQYDEMASGIYEPDGPEFDFTIAAIVRFPGEIALDEARSPRAGFLSTENLMIVSEEFFLIHRDDMINFGSSFNIRLDDGAAGIDDFVDTLRRSMANPDDLITFPWTVAENESAFSVPVDLETSALLAVGVGAGLIAFLFGVLLIRLERRLLDDDYPVLRAMGFTTQHLTRTAVLRMVPAALAGGTIAVAGAIFLSDRFPIGVGRKLEFHRGRQVNVALVVGGLLFVVTALVGGAALSARRAGIRRTQTSPARTRAILGTTRLPLHASIGARLAASGRDRERSSPAAATIITAIAATAIVIGVSTWLAGTANLYDTPSARGWVWDLEIGNVNFPLDDATLDAVPNSPLVSASTGISYGQAAFNGVSAEVLAFDPEGTAPLQTLRGRLPITDSEVALGAGLMRKLDVAIGDSVVFSLSESEFVEPPAVGGDIPLTVVGESVSPVFGESDIADIGVVTLQAIAAANGNAAPSMIMVDVIGPDVSANIDALIAPLSEEVHSDRIPARIVNLQRVRSLPNVGRSLAVALGLIAIAATLLAPARANRRKLAVLSALGLDRRGRRIVVTWQGVFTAAVVLVIGIPIGLVVGATWWRSVTDDLGVTNAVAWPTSAVTITIVSAAVGAIVAALIAVRHVSVARTLRGE